MSFAFAKTRMIVLSHIVGGTIVRLDKPPARDGRTNRQTDGQICRGYYSTLHCGRAVKTMHLVVWG